MSNITYSLPIPNSKTKGNSAIYRHPQFLNKELAKCPEEKITTIQESFVNACKKFPLKKCLGTLNEKKNDYNWKTYTQVLLEAELIGSGIINLNLAPEKTEWNNMRLRMIGVYSRNREEWLTLDYANALYRGTMIPLYDTLGPETIGYVIGHSNLEVLFIEKKVIKNLWDDKTALHNLKTLVSFDENVEQSDLDQINKRGLKLYYWKDILEAGKNKKAYAKIEPEDIHSFSYTSGTTGPPKAAMMTHKNFIAIIVGAQSTSLNLGAGNEIYLSYLPLPHIFERLVVIAIQYYGSAIAFYGGDMLKLKEDLPIAKPTLFCSVPRLYGKFYEKIQEKFEAAGGCAKCLISKGLNAKMENLKKAQVTHGLYDALVFNKTKNILGGHVTRMVSGSAPISPKILEFMKVVMCCPFLEGYGQTESTGASFVQDINDPTVGHVGGVISALEFKLEDIPDMEYTSDDKDADGKPYPRGEICLRGHTVFGGYYKDEEKTKETIDKDGWLHTGDVGAILPNGALKIIDRKKNIFKLSQGEYVSPEKVENMYMRAKGVQEVFVYGDSLQNYAVAIVVMDPEAAAHIAQENNIKYNDVKELAKNDLIRDQIHKNMTNLGKKEGLKGFEQAKRIYLETTPFQEKDCQTNTMKLQRFKAKKVFQKEIDQLYAMGEPK